MLDSGIRCGEDIVKALALGSGFVFIGRPFLYALAVKGESGAEFLIEMLMRELRTASQLTGVNSTDSCKKQLNVSQIDVDGHFHTIKGPGVRGDGCTDKPVSANEFK